MGRCFPFDTAYKTTSVANQDPLIGCQLSQSEFDIHVTNGVLVLAILVEILAQ